MSEHEFKNLTLGQRIVGPDGQVFMVSGIYNEDREEPHRINATKTVEIVDPAEWEAA
jgi:hypothetical protein